MRVPLGLLVICLACSLAGDIAFAQSNASETPPATAAATPSPKMPGYLVIRDQTGKVTGTEPNPEAKIPWNVTSTTSLPGTAPKPRNLFWDILNTLLHLALVLVVAYLAMLALQKYYRHGGRLPTLKSAGGPVSSSCMRLLETLPLGAGHSLHLVAIGKRCYLLGVAGQDVRLLGDMSDETVVTALLARLQAETPTSAGAPPFADILARLLPRGGATPPPHDSA